MRRELTIIVLLGVLSGGIALGLHYLGALNPLEQPLAVLAGAGESGEPPLLSYPFLQVFLVALGAILMAWWALSLSHPVVLALVLIFALVEWFAFKPLLADSGLAYAASPGLVAIVLSALGGVVVQRLPAQKRRRQLLLALDGRTAPRVRDELLKRSPALDTPLKAAVVTYSDPAGAWEFPLGTLLNAGGIVAGYDPKRIAIVFTSLTAGDNPRLAAGKALLEACREMQPLKPSPQSAEATEAGHEPAPPQIAIESGEINPRLVNGNGSPDPQLLFEGPLMEIAFRLNQACALFPARILAGPKFQQALADEALFRPVELVRFGVNQPVRELYQLIGLREFAKPQEIERAEHFWKGVIFFREGQYSKSHDAFLQAQPLEGKDPLLEDYLRRLNRAQTEEAEMQAGARRTRPAFVI